MSNVLEGGLILQGMTHHGMLRRSVRVPRGRAGHVRAGHVLVLVILVVQVRLVIVLGPFMFVGTAIILITADNLVNVARGELVQLLIVAKYDDGDVDRAKHGKLMRLLEKTALALQKCY
jgi:hypothetical protein